METKFEGPVEDAVIKEQGLLIQPYWQFLVKIKLFKSTAWPYLYSNEELTRSEKTLFINDKKTQEMWHSLKIRK